MKARLGSLLKCELPLDAPTVPQGRAVIETVAVEAARTLAVRSVVRGSAV